MKNKKDLTFAIKETRRNRAWELNLDGYSCQDISVILAEEGLGTHTPSTIGRILHQMNAKIVEDFKEKTDLIKSRKHAEFEAIRVKCMEGYRLSRSYAIVEEEVKLKNGKTKFVEKKIKTPGDVRFLATAIQAMDRVIKLWGLDTPQKVDMRVTNASVDLNQAIDQFRNLQEEMRNWEKSRLEEGSKQLTIIPEAEIISVPIEGENQNEKRSNDVES